MSEPSNNSVQGLIGSLGASGKASVEKGGIRQASDKPQDGAFSRELGQALEKHSAVSQPDGGRPAARQATEAGTAAVSAEAKPASAAVDDANLPAALAGSAAETDSADSASTGLSPATAGPAEESLLAARRGQPEAAVDAAPVAALKDTQTTPEAKTSDTATGQALPSPTANKGSESAADSTTVRVGHSDVTELADPSPSAQTAASAGSPEEALQIPQNDARSAPTEQVGASVLPQPAAAASADMAGKLAQATGDEKPGLATVAASGSRSASDPALATTTQPLTSTVAATSSLSPQTATTPASAKLTAVDSASPAVQGSDAEPLTINRTASGSSPEAGDTEPGLSDQRILSATKAARAPSATVTAAALSHALSASGVQVDTESATPASHGASMMQPVEVGEVISQASLAARYRFAGTGLEGQRAVSPDGEAQSLVSALASGVGGKTASAGQPIETSAAVDNSLTQLGAGKGADADAMPLNMTEAALEEGEAVFRHADLFKDIQAQRAALSETAGSQAAQASVVTGDTLARSASADNMLLPATGGIVTAPVVQRADAVTASPVSAPFDVSMLSEDAETGLAGNVKWMVKEGVQNATVTVTPSGMGPISVKVGIDQDQLNVSIMASQHTTREALDAMLPRLREQLAAQGHESVKLDVSDGRGEQSKGGNGQMFAGTRNPSDSWTQREQGNSGGNDNQAEYGSSGDATGHADAHMAEDLQRVVLSSAGASGTSSAFDAYV